MKLATKVYLSTAIVATLGVAATGASSVMVAYDSEISAVKNTMLEDISLIDATSYDALGDALNVGLSSSTPISIAYLDNAGRLSLIHDDGPDIPVAPSKSELVKTANTPTITGENLVASLKLDTGGYLIFVSSLALENQHLNDNLARLAANYAITLFSMLAVVWLTLRRDLRSIRRIRAAALQIADGNLSARLPNKKGNSEVEELSRSLAKMVDRLNRAIETERKSKEAIESFIGDASHELRTPLTVIRGYSELLTQPGFKGQADASERIIREVDKMTSLVTDLLLLARLEETEPELEECDLLDIVLESVENLKLLGPTRPVTTKLEPVVARSNRALIERFLANTTSNISRYVPIECSVSVSLTENKNRILLVIEDAGPGLPATAYKQGIRSFKRFDASRSKDSGGTGLGMSIMASIAERLGGEVKLSKSKLGGLKVSLQLPTA